MKPLTPKEIEEWFEQHIKSRVYATLASPELVRMWLNENPTAPVNERWRQMFLLQASWEGRHAAL